MKTVKFYTLGCKVNQYDTQSIRERFLSRGFRQVNNGGSADYCLINTCTVTQQADRKSWAAIRQSIKRNPQAKVIVTGCLVEKRPIFIKGIALVISKRFFPEGISDFSDHARAFVKIQDGCNHLCSYCKVPLVRGRSRLRPKLEVIQEAARLAGNGFKEIVLSGICLGAHKDLVGIIQALEHIEGIQRIRLSSIELAYLSKGLIEQMAKSPKLCRHLHIPLQSGDRDILRKMQRNYTPESYFKKIKEIKKKVPQLAITTDCLVGFPSETEENFANTVRLIKKILPLKIHVFPYSQREGTLASRKYPFLVEPKIIAKRVAYIKEVAQESAREFKQKFLHREMDVLFEGRSKKDPCFWQGHTDNYILVQVSSELDLENQLLRVRLKQIEGDFVNAEIVSFA
jgi:threonylcarbamoyladenosine tRNA methylthiotransferase MtaB